MTKKFCDRCRKEVDSFEIRTITMKEHGYFLYEKGEMPMTIGVSELDLCRGCKDILGKYISGWVDELY